jgi:isopenicillin-N N-acyltransferase-like protein
MKHLTLKGSFFEMGQQYGKESQKEIKTFSRMAYLMASLSKKPGSQPFNPNMRYLLPAYFSYKKEKHIWQDISWQYEHEIWNYYPEAIAFMKGIADGADLPYIDVLSLNVATEHMITCSAWGATGNSTLNNEPLIGMNSDEEPISERYEHFLDIKPKNGYRYKVTALAGWVGFNHGMNETGLAVAGSLLWTKPEPTKTLRPPMLVLMKVLNTCSSVEEVKAYFESVPNHELGTVFYVADRQKLMRVECTYAKKVFEVLNNGSLGNTNLPTSPELQHLNGSPEMKQTLHAETRTLRMIKLLHTYEGRLDVDAMHAIASDHGEKKDGTLNKSMCQHPKKIMYNYKTLVSFVAQPKEKCFWIYEGCPCKNKVSKYDFKD